MSLKPEPMSPIPQETVRLAKAVFPEGSTFIKMRDELGTLFQDEMFVTLFPKDGQPALAPWRLALVTIMQFAEGLSDRQAANAVRDHYVCVGILPSEPRGVPIRHHYSKWRATAPMV